MQLDPTTAASHLMSLRKSKGIANGMTVKHTVSLRHTHSNENISTDGHELNNDASMD